MIDYSTAPNNFGDTWQYYMERGISPGSFGEALLCNDLVDAVHRADWINKDLIPQHVMWLWDNLPYEAWGSKEAYEKWTKMGGTAGRLINGG